MNTTRFLSLFAAVALAPVAHAVDFDWTGTSGVDNNWLTAGNWSVGGVPSATPPTGGATNFARFTAPMPAPAIINANTPDIQDFLTGNNGAAGLRQIDHVAGSANFNSGWFRMGALGGTGDVGTYNLSGGQVNTGAYRIGEQTGQIATVNVSGGVLRQNDVGDIGNGDSWNRIGLDATANVNLSGTGVISFDSRTLIGVGNGSTNIVQTGGMFEVRRGEFTLGDGKAALSAAPNDVYNISGGTLIARTNTGNGDSGGNITVGQWDNANAKLFVSGNALVRADQDINIANGREVAHKGEIEMTGGQMTFGSSFHMSTNLASTSLFTMSGGQLMQDTVDPEDQANWNHIGANGAATFNISSGLASFNARTHLGSVAGSNATVNQTGGVFEVRNHELIIGDAGTAIYNINAGKLQSARAIAVGNWNSSNGSLNIDGTAEVIAADRLLIGQVQDNTFVSSGTVTMTGGKLTVGTNIDMTVSATSNATFIMAGGLVDLTNGDVNFGPGTSSFQYFDGVLRGVANFRRALVQAGGIFEVGGTVGAGGLTTILGDFTGDGTLRLELAPGNVGDVLAVNGLVSISGGLDLVPGALTLGDTFVILQNDGVDPIAGVFAGLPEGQTFIDDGTAFQIHYNAGDGNDVSVQVVVPEPGTILALLGGFGVLALRRRRNS